MLARAYSVIFRCPVWKKSW